MSEELKTYRIRFRKTAQIMIVTSSPVEALKAAIQYLIVEEEDE